VPVLDTPLFMGGLLAFWFAVALTFLQPRLVRPGSAMAALPGVSGSAGSAIRVAGLIYLLAMLSFIGAWKTTPDTHTGWPFYELLFWGAGHVLQFANEAGMLAAWLILLTHALGSQPVSRNVVRALLAVLIIPPLAGPVLTFMGVTGEHHYDSFTRLMQWGIFPVVTVMLVLCMTACFRNTQNAPRGRGALRPLLRHPSFTGFAASAFLTVTGFVLGGLISLVPESTTLIPAHYHAAIGAVTVAYMAVTFVLLESWGIPIASERLRRMSVWQPLLFGVGQFIMALGFAIAGYHKAARKVYGADQQVRSTGEYVGLVIMGIGGAFAIVGGVMFLIIVIRSYVVARRANRAV
ncbi:MAG: cbb3-type cytochrome c oxidase subunit I, partial [Planctomycetes bacterium]|nr:cbb3-type cytochrome c oxidase subunit I [Planctomycetota bacterium]